jgi:hypothetical protein
MRISPWVLVLHALALVHLVPLVALRTATSDAERTMKTADVRKLKILTEQRMRSTFDSNLIAQNRGSNREEREHTPRPRKTML